MAEYRTREQAEAYLARIFNPDRRFHLYEMEGGWLVQSVLSQEEIDSGLGLGMTSLVVDAEDGTVYQYPSWSTDMIADNFEESKRRGERPQALQVYPPQLRLSIQRVHEDPETIGYDVRVTSLMDRPEDNAEYRLMIEKATLMYQPNEPKASNVASWAEMRSRQNGVWPDEGTWER